MPYLDLTDHENYVHLLQLFQAAHPGYRQDNATIRAKYDMPDQYFLSLEMTKELAAWGRKRHLITRKDADRLVEIATNAFAHSDPSSIVSLTPRVLGTPPRLQPTVLSSEIFHWLSLRKPGPKESTEVMVFTVPAAIEILQAAAADANEPDGIRLRAQQLVTWLQQHG